MKKYAEIIDQKTKQCDVGLGDSDESIKIYKEMGMKLLDVEKAYDGNWYLTGYVPVEPIYEAKERARQERETAYTREVDPITTHIQRLRDTNPMTPEIENEISELISERDSKYLEIQERYPYPEETENEVS